MSSPKLRFESCTFDAFENAGLSNVDVLFVGEEVDDRGNHAVGHLARISKRVVKLGFIPEDNHLLIDDKRQPLSQLEIICRGKSIRIEATTLGLAEILKVIQAARNCANTTLEFTYIEPKEYVASQNQRHEGEYLNPRDFELTDNRFFRSLHGFAHQRSADVSESHFFFLGYESSRLLQAFEQPEFEVAQKYAAFGVPAFEPGWETNALANHAKDLRNLKFNSNQILYCEANSIREGYLTLWEIYDRIGSERSTFVVSPLGTKPHSVAAALFLVETKGSSNNTALYYDHPKRRQQRSRDIKACHLVKVTGLSKT